MNSADHLLLERVQHEKIPSRFKFPSAKVARLTAHCPIPTSPVLQRARGSLKVGGQQAPDGLTRLKDLHQQGSLRAVFPRSYGGVLEAVIVNTAGGVTGGDHFTADVTAHEGARISITTQAAERIYAAPDLDAGLIQTTLIAKQHAQLYWLPQETILFDQARLRRRLEVDVHPTARFLMVEPLVFGREASGEVVRSASLDDRVSLTSEGRRTYLDRIRLEGNIAAQLMRPALANGARAVANIVLVDANAKSLLDPVRALLPATAGASLLRDTVLVVRLLAPDSFALRTHLLPILTLLTNNAMPKNWRL